MQNEPRPPSAKLPPILLKRIDRVAMAVYVCLVYAWSIALGPLGRDFAAFANAGAQFPFPLNRFFAWETGLFGATVQGYHIVNILLLYTCMVFLYHVVNATLRGPVWFGTLAATLFMANPVHSEAALNLCGIVDLGPCVFGLGALAAYFKAHTHPNRWRVALAALTLMAAVLPFTENIGLALVVVAHRLFQPPEKRNLAVIAAALTLGAISVALHFSVLAAQGFSLARAFVPLYFLFYPIGFLPETAQLFHTQPLVAWAAAMATAAILVFVCVKARRAPLVFGLLSMMLVRLFQGDKLVDPVHLLGGGQLLLANAFFAMALCAVFYRIMENANWRSTIVTGTTVLCAVFFVMEIRVIRAWDYAGRQTREFQQRASTLAASHPGETMAVAPDFQYYLGAPMCLSQAIAFDTPFSRAFPAKSIFAVHYDKSALLKVGVDAWGPQQSQVSVDGASPIRVMPWPYTLIREGATGEVDGVRLELSDVAQDRFRVTLTPVQGAFPDLLIPSP